MVGTGWWRLVFASLSLALALLAIMAAAPRSVGSAAEVEQEIASSGDAFQEAAGQCLYYPPGPSESQPIEAPCDQPVCWSEPPPPYDSEFHPALDCAAEYCWFSPPGVGPFGFELCSGTVCWLALVSEGEGTVYVPVSCDEEFCSYFDPDAAQSIEQDCDDLPVCWAQPPEGGAWTDIRGCGTPNASENCWASPPFEGSSFLWACGEAPCFIVPSPEVIVFSPAQPGYPRNCGATGACWPVTGSGGQVVAWSVPCGQVGTYCIATPEGGGTSFALDCTFEICWGLDAPFAVYLGLPPETPIPVSCGEGEGPSALSPAVALPVVVQQGTLTPVDVVEGSVQPITLAITTEGQPAELLPSGRIERLPDEGVVVPPDSGFGDPGYGNGPSPSDEERDSILAPDSGSGIASGHIAGWTFLLTAALAGAVVGFSAAGVVRGRR